MDMRKNTTKHKTVDQKLGSGEGSKSSHIKWKFADYGKDKGNVMRPLKIKWKVNFKVLEFMCLGIGVPLTDRVDKHEVKMMCFFEEESEKHISKLFDELVDKARSVVPATIRFKPRWRSTSEHKLDAQSSEMSSTHLNKSRQSGCGISEI